MSFVVSLADQSRVDGRTGGGTGKSSLTLRYMKEMFVDSYDPTIEGTWFALSVASHVWNESPTRGRLVRLESYRKTVKVDGEMCNVRRWPYSIVSSSLRF